VINTEMLVHMLENHRIFARQQLRPGETEDEDDLNRMADVFVPAADYDRAHELFYKEREDEL
jgi:hypothetical protein